MGSNAVSVFWDYENCRIPSELTNSVLSAASNLRQLAHSHGDLKMFRAYMETSLERSSKASKLRSELQSSGVSLIDTPHNGSKDVADKMIIVDMMVFALDQKAPATIILVSGDKDFAYAMSTLRNRRYTIVLLCPQDRGSDTLKSQADIVLGWRSVLGVPPQPAKSASEGKKDKHKPPKKRDWEHYDPLEDERAERRAQKKLKVRAVPVASTSTYIASDTEPQSQASTSKQSVQPLTTLVPLKASIPGDPLPPPKKSTDIEILTLSDDDDEDEDALAALRADAKRVRRERRRLEKLYSAKRDPVDLDRIAANATRGDASEPSRSESVASDVTFTMGSAGAGEQASTTSGISGFSQKKSAVAVTLELSDSSDGDVSVGAKLE